MPTKWTEAGHSPARRHENHASETRSLGDAPQIVSETRNLSLP